MAGVLPCSVRCSRYCNPPPRPGPGPGLRFPPDSSPRPLRFFLEAAPPALRLPPQFRGDSDSDTVSIRSQSPSERAACAAIAVRACHPRPSCSAATVPAQASGRLRVHASAPHSRRPCSTPTAFPARFLLGGDGAGSTCTGPAALPPRSHLNRPRRLRSLPSTPTLLLCSTARAAALLRLRPLSRG